VIGPTAETTLVYICVKNNLYISLGTSDLPSWKETPRWRGMTKDLNMHDVGTINLVPCRRRSTITSVKSLTDQQVQKFTTSKLLNSKLLGIAEVIR
jgi:hypothetical protein